MNKKEFNILASEHNLSEHIDYDFVDDNNELSMLNVDHYIVPIYGIIKFININEKKIIISSLGYNYLCIESEENRLLLKRNLKFNKLINE